jgi:hypothetical protein
LFVYFVNDQTHISTTRLEWTGALQLARCLLGAGNHKLQKYIINGFIDVKNLKTSLLSLAN